LLSATLVLAAAPGGKCGGKCQECRYAQIAPFSERSEESLRYPLSEANSSSQVILNPHHFLQPPPTLPMQQSAAAKVVYNLNLMNKNRSRF
jgi:hypothetical protein